MKKERITLGEGSGGKLMHRLLDGLLLKELANDILLQKKDASTFRLGSRELAFTTDSYVVDPIFFPGGDIGSLAVYGTVNDLAVSGARPLYLSLGLIIEEGFPKRDLERIVRSIRDASRRAGVQVITGDTKVVGKGSCDKIFINTSGIGEVYYPRLSTKYLRSGDAVIVNGTLGEHAVSVLSKREGISFRTAVRSDSCPLNGIIERLTASSCRIKFMRDTTRGGLATTLNEIASGAGKAITIDEDALPLSSGVRHAAELLGLDPLYLACEGRFVAIVAAEDAGKAIALLRKTPEGRGAAIVGRVEKGPSGMVMARTAVGGRRIIDMLPGEQLPRIC